MFRHATEGTEKPCWMVVCDNPRCNVTARMEIPSSADSDGVRDQFIRSAVEAGWWITVGEQLCGLHAQTARDRKSAKELIRHNRVLVPKLVERQ